MSFQLVFTSLVADSQGPAAEGVALKIRRGVNTPTPACRVASQAKSTPPKFLHNYLKVLVQKH